MRPIITTLYFLFSVLIALGILFLVFALFQYYPSLPTKKAFLLEEVLGWLTGGYVFPASVYASLLVIIHYAITRLFRKPFFYRIALGLAALNLILYIAVMTLIYSKVIPPIPWGFY